VNELNIFEGARQQWFPKDIICPMYHLVSDADLPHVRYYPYKNTHQFEADVAYLRQAFSFIEYDDLVRVRKNLRATRRIPAIFTFDDGFAECYTIAKSILLRHEAPAVFFVVTDWIDNQRFSHEIAISLCISELEQLSDRAAGELERALRVNEKIIDRVSGGAIRKAELLLGYSRVPLPKNETRRSLLLWLLSLHSVDNEEINLACEYLGVDAERYVIERKPYLSEDQICQLANDGFVIGAHSLSHRRLKDLDPHEIEHEIAGSCDLIRQLTGRAKVPFAFPHHGDGIDRSLLVSLLRKYDFIDLLFDGRATGRDESFVVGRVWADSPEGCQFGASNLPETFRISGVRTEVRSS
jgi:peptidoglycan/xylan/chitin deacetylase (PgdA/CDA1 family)